MKIASYNIKSGGFTSYFSKSATPEKLALIKLSIKQINADFIALIDTCRWEQTFSDENLSEMFGYKSVYRISIHDEKLLIPIGITVLTNLPVLGFENCRIFDRDCIKTVIKEKDRVINLFSIYLDYQDEEIRSKQILSLLEQAEDRNTIILGDYNSLRPEDAAESGRLFYKIVRLLPFIRLSSGFKGTIKTVKDMLLDQKVINLLRSRGFIEAKGSEKFEPTMPTKFFFPLIPPIFKVDYIFHTPDISVNNFQILKGKVFDKASDHYPIACEVV